MREVYERSVDSTTKARRGQVDVLRRHKTFEPRAPLSRSASNEFAAKGGAVSLFLQRQRRTRQALVVCRRLLHWKRDYLTSSSSRIRGSASTGGRSRPCVSSPSEHSSGRCGRTGSSRDGSTRSCWSQFSRLWQPFATGTPTWIRLTGKCESLRRRYSRASRSSRAEPNTGWRALKPASAAWRLRRRRCRRGQRESKPSRLVCDQGRAGRGQVELAARSIREVSDRRGGAPGTADERDADPRGFRLGVSDIPGPCSGASGAADERDAKRRGIPSRRCPPSCLPHRT